MANRWVTLAAGIYLMLCAGPIFSFGAIGKKMQHILNASESEMQMISVAGNVGLWTNIVGGFVFDRLGGPKTMVVSAVLTLAGYLMMHSALDPKQPWTPVATAGAWFLVGHGSGWLYISTLFSNVKNFEPKQRGFVIGIMACFFGASATVWVAILNGCMGGAFSGGACVGGYVGGDVTAYMLLLAVAVPSCILLCASLTRTAAADAILPAGPGDGKRFNLVLVGTFGVIAFVCGSNYYALRVAGGGSVSVWADFALLGLLLLFVAVPLGTNDARPITLLGSAAGAAGSSAGTVQPPAAAVAATNMSPGQAVRSWRFRCLWLTFGATVGADIMALNIVSSITHSRKLDGSVASLCVIVFMACDTLTRFLSGYVVGKGVSATLVLFGGPLLMSVAQLLLAAADTDTGMYVACIVLGLSDGIMWSLGPLLTGKLFGMKHSGKNFGMVVLAAAIFALALSLSLEPRVYQAHVSAGGKECFGKACFALTHYVCAALGVGALLAVGSLHSASKQEERPPSAWSALGVFFEDLRDLRSMRSRRGRGRGRELETRLADAT